MICSYILIRVFLFKRCWYVIVMHWRAYWLSLDIKMRERVDEELQELQEVMLQIMELNDDAKWEKIHTKFKELVKKYHPDKNQGSKKFEDKLKKITLAYSQLKKTLGKK